MPERVSAEFTDSGNLSSPLQFAPNTCVGVWLTPKFERTAPHPKLPGAEYACSHIANRFPALKTDPGILVFVGEPYSAGLGLVALISLVIPVLSARLLAFDLLGYHVPDRPPHPEIWGLVLVLGLSLAIVGQLLGAGRNEGARSRGWVAYILYARDLSLKPHPFLRFTNI